MLLLSAHVSYFTFLKSEQYQGLQESLGESIPSLLSHNANFEHIRKDFQLDYIVRCDQEGYVLESTFYPNNLRAIFRHIAFEPHVSTFIKTSEGYDHFSFPLIQNAQNNTLHFGFQQKAYSLFEQISGQTLWLYFFMFLGSSLLLFGFIYSQYRLQKITKQRTIQSILELNFTQVFIHQTVLPISTMQHEMNTRIIQLHERMEILRAHATIHDQPFSHAYDRYQRLVEQTLFSFPHIKKRWVQQEKISPKRLVRWIKNRF